MDLAKLKPNDRATIRIKHPSTGEELGVVIVVYGMDSKAFNASRHKIQNRILKKKKNVRTAEEIRQDSIQTLADCTAEWWTEEYKEKGKDKGKWIKVGDFIEWNGDRLECNVENAKLLYSNLDWMKDQIDTEIGDIANFLA